MLNFPHSDMLECRGTVKVAESFFSTLEFELIERKRFVNRVEARSDVFEFIEVFYNRQRSHQTLDYRTPEQVEQEYQLVA